MIELGDDVLVTTKHRGVYFGKLIDRSEGLDNEGHVSVALSGARCAIQFGTTGGFLELAETGPTPKSKIGAEAPEITLYGCTSVTKCSDEASAAWRK